MILLPAIDLHQGQCVRLLRGDYDTAQVVAADPVETARAFEEQGAGWLHVVDLDGAKEGAPKNAELIAQVVERTGLQVEVGGGIRNMATVDRYLELGAARVILGSAALRDPQFVAEAVKRYGKRVAVGIDALGGKVAAEGLAGAEPGGLSGAGPAHGGPGGAVSHLHRHLPGRHPGRPQPHHAGPAQTRR